MNNLVLIFDFDGTIADTHHYICHIGNMMCDEFGFSPIKFDELPVLRHKSTEEIIRYLKVPLLKIPAIVARGKRELEKNINELKSFQGLRDVLLTLKANVEKIGILSSNSSQNIKTFLEINQMQFFDFIHTTPKIWSKDHSLTDLLKKNGFEKERMIYVGDEIRDILSARKVGIRTASVTWGYNSREVLQSHSPDYLLDAPLDLLKICEPFSVVL